jgi:hypothetical protein
MSVTPEGGNGMGAGERGASVGAGERGASVGAGESHLTMGVYRLLRAWRALPGERRLAAGASLGLFLTLFLPWYQETVIARGLTNLRSISASLTGWQAFSFVEAAVLLVAAATLVLLFMRSEGRAFHVPGGDGGVITVAGLWTCVLIVWRMFDKEGTAGHGSYATTSGIEWGIFVALGVAALLAYAGTRIRLAHEPEPPLPGEPPVPRGRGGRIPGLKRRRRAKTSRGPGPAPSRKAHDGSPLVQPHRVTKDQPTAETAVTPRPSRAPEMELDETWTQRPAARPGQRPAARPGQRRSERPADARPPSASQARLASSSDPRPASSSESPSATSSDSRSSRPIRRRRPRSLLTSDPAEAPTRALDRREIAGLDISEPPTARMGRPGKPSRPTADAEDQLTTRLDRPD